MYLELILQRALVDTVIKFWRVDLVETEHIARDCTINVILASMHNEMLWCYQGLSFFLEDVEMCLDKAIKVLEYRKRELEIERNIAMLEMQKDQNLKTYTKCIELMSMIEILSAVITILMEDIDDGI